MKALFEYGYQLARTGYPWHKTPPGLVVSKSPDSAPPAKKLK